MRKSRFTEAQIIRNDQGSGGWFAQVRALSEASVKLRDILQAEGEVWRHGAV